LPIWVWLMKREGRHLSPVSTERLMNEKEAGVFGNCFQLNCGTSSLSKLVSSRDRVIGSSPQLWPCPRRARLVITMSPLYRTRNALRHYGSGCTRQREFSMCDPNDQLRELVVRVMAVILSPNYEFGD
jgi:hypothetical protein